MRKYSKKEKRSFSNKRDPRAVLVRYAKKHLGKPYKYGAKPWEAPKVFDCSSFVQYLYRRIGRNIPRTTIEQIDVGRSVSPKKLEVGDILFRKGGWGRYNPDHPDGVGHCGIYIGDGKIAHARWDPRGGRVMVESVDKAFLEKSDFRGVRRILK